MTENYVVFILFVLYELIYRNMSHCAHYSTVIIALNSIYSITGFADNESNDLTVTECIVFFFFKVIVIHHVITSLFLYKVYWEVTRNVLSSDTRVVTVKT
jgi:hypothetical protein